MSRCDNDRKISAFGVVMLILLAVVLAFVIALFVISAVKGVSIGELWQTWFPKAVEEVVENADAVIRL